ncbi:MAG: hypothetical protein F9K40_08820 [Kofleriaceae bacterium]|nr:MAG: hypothetical protein F9K40_08820 [Kofleriaceae bacterium]MBZ0235966.1 hypothetical protein [Kofleriaceae bacterium]
MRTAATWFLVITACGGGASVPDDANFDGTMADAVSIDAPDDAPADGVDATPVDAPPLHCTESQQMIADVTPLRIWSVAALDDTVYFTTYDPDDLDGGGEVRAIAMSNLEVSTVGTITGIANLEAIDGWLYVADGGTVGSLWRYQSGQPVQQLATNRSSVLAVAVDATQVYWREATSQSSMLMRAPLAGGAPSPIDEVDVWRLAVDDQRLYAVGFGAALGYRKDNWFRNWYAGGLLLATDVLIDDGELIVVDNLGVHAARPPSMTFTPLATLPTQERHGGMTLRDNYLWITAEGYGIKRVHRQGGSLEQVTLAAALGEPVFAGPYLAWRVDSTLHRCVP